VRDTLVGGGHHVRRVEELDNRLDGQGGARRWRSEEHHELAAMNFYWGESGHVEPRCEREVQHGCDALSVSSRRRR
jgi:hypothetical protein